MNVGLFGEEIRPSVRDMFVDGDVDGLFSYYRESGFPNYRKDSYSAKAELEKVRQADADEYWSECAKTYRKYSSANGFLFSYFPHWIDVRCGKSASLREAWDDDALLRELIRKTVVFCRKHGEDWTENRLRQNAKVYCAKQSVSNFNPVCARMIYDEFAPDGVVYDMSMGWGGRLLGFYASRAKFYIGVDPCVKTYEGLCALDDDLASVSLSRKLTSKFNVGSEVFQTYRHIVDLCFSSPPYFDTERYSDEPTQSYVKFRTPVEWADCFLGRTIENYYSSLKDDGFLVMNIADTPKVRPSEFLVQMAESIGFRHLETRWYELSSVSKASAKLEPVYVFGKGAAEIRRRPTLFD